MNRKSLIVLLSVIVVLSMAAPVLAVNTVESPPRFEESSVSTHVGDTVYFNVDYDRDHENRTTIKIGDKDKVGYVLEAEITGANPHSNVKIALDTTAAGIASEPTIRTVGYSDASINITRETRLSDHPIDPATYPMELTYDGKTVDLSQIQLFQSDSPQPVDILRMRTNADVNELYEKEGLNEKKTVAVNDNAVIRFNSNGTFNYLSEEYSATDFEKRGDVHEEHGIFITMEQTETEINEDPENIGLNNAKFHMSEENGKSLLIIQTSKYGMEPGDSFEVTIHITDKNKYLNSGEYKTEFKIVERRVNLDTDKDDIIYISTDYYGSTITGNSSLSEGTSITAVAQRDSNPAIFVREHTQVSENGQFSFDLDIDSDTPVGTQIDLSFANVEGGATLYVTEDGEPPEEPPTTTTTKPPAGTEGTQNIPTTTNRTDSTTVSPTTEPNETITTPTTTEKSDDDNSGFPKPPQPGQPGYGPIAALLAVVGGLIIVARRSR